MELLPAIDLRAGTAVRLTQGDFGREERYGDPVGAGGPLHRRRGALDPRRRPRRRPARACRTSAACWARSCGSARAAGVSVEFGGGIRSEDDAEEVLESGVARVVLGHRRPRGARAGGPLRPALAGPGGRRARLPGRRRRGGRGPGPGMARRVGPRRDRSPRALGEGAHRRGRGHVGGARRHAVGPRPRGVGSALLAATALPVVASGGVSGVDGPGGAGPPGGRGPDAWPGPSWARPSWRAGSAWRRASPRAQRPPDPLPRRHRRARRQGRALRRPDRRGRPGRAGRPLRRRGRRRGHVPRHHRLLRRSRHDGLGGGAHGRAGLHPAHRRGWGPGGGGCTPPPPGRGGQGRGEHSRRGTTRSWCGTSPTSSAASAPWWPSTPGPGPGADGWEVHTHGGRTPVGRDVVAWAVECAATAPARSS